MIELLNHERFPWKCLLNDRAARNTTEIAVCYDCSEYSSGIWYSRVMSKCHRYFIWTARFLNMSFSHEYERNIMINFIKFAYKDKGVLIWIFSTFGAIIELIHEPILGIFNIRPYMEDVSSTCAITRESVKVLKMNKESSLVSGFLSSFSKL